MSQAVLLRKTKGGFEPIDEYSEAACSRIKPGEVVKISRSRSLPMHNAFWAMLQRVADAAGYESKQDLYHALLLRTKRYNLMKLQNGRVVPVLHSTSFDAMDQAEFAAFVDEIEPILFHEVMGGEDPMGLLAWRTEAPVRETENV